MSDLIRTTTELEEACGCVRADGVLSLDTEFVWKCTYLPCLGIVQMGGRDFCCAVDCRSGLDTSALRDMIEDRYNKRLALHGTDLVTTNMPIGEVNGKIADGERYVGLNPRFAKAFAWLQTTDLAALGLGRHEIDGDDVYANVMEVELKRWSADATLEAHHAYIDVHVPISGEETVGYAYDERCRTAADFNVKDDYCLVKNAKMRPITLKPGEFAAFFPPCGAHAPNQIFGESRRHKKLVVKVRA